MIQTVYMLVTKDKYELPLIVCDSAEELAEKTGKTRSSVYKAVQKKSKRIVKLKINVKKGE